MILTRDNILRYVKDKKAVTPTMIAEDFDTSTMIASAALSELAKDKLINITFLKLASSPYYYDPKQSSVLIDLGNKHLKGYDKELFLKLKEQEVINVSSLSIQEGLAMERILDFGKTLSIDNGGKILKFLVWFQRDISETKKQILEVLFPVTKSTEIKKSKSTMTKKSKFDESLIKSKSIVENKKDIKNIVKNNFSNEGYNSHSLTNTDYLEKKPVKFTPKESFENKIENFIENYFRENYLQMESKQKNEKGVVYDVILHSNKILTSFDCFYFKKKPTEADVIKFYSSSIKPKIVFVENVPKKLLKLAGNLDNLTVVNI